jgi:hypothetical protein
MMIFTVFTIIFVRQPLLLALHRLTLATAKLPLSFFTSLYGMNAREWSGTETNVPLRSIALVGGTVSAFIIIFAILGACWSDVLWGLFGSYWRKLRPRRNHVQGDEQLAALLAGMAV